MLRHIVGEPEERKGLSGIESDGVVGGGDWWRVRRVEGEERIRGAQVRVEGDPDGNVAEGRYQGIRERIRAAGCRRRDVGVDILKSVTDVVDLVHRADRRGAPNGAGDGEFGEARARHMR